MLLGLFVLICFIGTKATARTAARVRLRPYGRIVGLITAAIWAAILLPELFKR